MEKLREELKANRSMAFRIAIGAVLMGAAMWLLAPERHDINLKYSLIMALPVLGLLWVGWTAHRDLKKLNQVKD